MNDFAWYRRVPWAIVGLAAALVAIGCLGIERAEELSGGGSKFLHRQLLWAVVSAVAMCAIALPSYRRLRGWSYAVFAASILMLLAVYFFPPVNGAQRWIRLGPVGLQPSEFAKLAFVLALARYLMHRESYRELRGLLLPLGLALAPVMLILKEPDLGTALLFFPVLFVMLYAAGARGRHLACAVMAAIVLTPLLWSQMSREQRSRITALAEQTGPGEKPTEDGYHLHQAKQMLALGGWSGSWIAGDAAADPSVYYVPEAHTDSITSVIGERFGIWGLTLVLLLFWALIWQALRVAAGTREPYGRLVAIGVAGLLATQTLINAGMMVGLLPITGLALPLVSYGGSSLLSTGLALGLLLNIRLNRGYEVGNEPFLFAD